MKRTAALFASLAMLAAVAPATASAATPGEELCKRLLIPLCR